MRFSYLGDSYWISIRNKWHNYRAFRKSGKTIKKVLVDVERLMKDFSVSYQFSIHTPNLINTIYFKVRNTHCYRSIKFGMVCIIVLLHNMK